jgi:catechol 2,3-dioxygenase-like lactoylglutathione lyase family enzyme
MAKIRHIAIFTDDPDKLAKFYVDVFGMTKTHETEASAESGRSVWITDGYMDVAIIHPFSEKSPRGVNHFGFTLDASEKAGIYQRLTDYGRAPYLPPSDRPYIEDAARDLDGNKFDLSTTGLRNQPGQAKKEKVEA